MTELGPASRSGQLSSGLRTRLASLDVRLVALVWGLLLLVIAGYSALAWHDLREASLRAAGERLKRVTQEVAAATSAGSDRLLEAAASPAAARWADPESPLAQGEAEAGLLEFADGQTVLFALVAPDGSISRWMEGEAFHSSLAPDDSPAAVLQTVVAPYVPAADGATVEVFTLRTISGLVFYDRAVALGTAARSRGALVERRLVAPVEASLAAIETLIGGDATLLIGNTGGDLWTDLRSVVEGPPPATLGAGATEYERGGATRLGHAEELPGLPFALLVEFPMATVTAPARAFLLRTVWIGGLLLVLGAAMAVPLARRIVAPLRELSAASEAIADGDYAQRVDIAGGGEIGTLADAFNRMAAEIEAARASDLRRRAAAEAARSHSDEYFRALVEHSLDMVVVVNRDGTVRFANSSSQEHLALGRVGATRPSLLDRIHPGDRDRIAAELRAPRGDTWELEFGCRADDDDAWLQMRGVACDLQHNPVISGVLLNLHDVTRHRELEDELRQAHKMEAVGRLAGGIAHDFNNLLAAITGSLDLVRLEQTLTEEGRRDLDEATSAASRAADLVRQLLAFGRRQAIEPTVLDPTHVIAGISRMLSRVVGERITVRTELDAEAGQVKVDRNQLEQVLMNLAVNARDAMPEGGTLVLQTNGIPAAGGEPAKVAIAVSDTGVGMDAATRSRIFEPFFTTKPEGSGTGLGLSTVYGILSQSGGAIRVESEPGAGSTFVIEFPRSEAAPEVDAIPADLRLPSTGHERILVVEDQKSVRRVVERVLRSVDYDVVSVATLAAGLEAIERGDDHDLLLTDVGLPDGRGTDLADRAHELRPDMRVLLMTGYDSQRVEERLRYPVIEKPFTLSELVDRVGEVLEGRTARLEQRSAS